jgi:exosortase family protein XrtF
MRQFLNNPFYVFLIKAFGLYFLWYILYELWLHPSGILDHAVISNLIFCAEEILKFIGYHLIQVPEGPDTVRVLGIDGTHGVWIGDPCNGISVFALFSGFILIFPGPSIAKIWFAPLGVLLIHLVNILRVVGLCVVMKYFPESLEFNHTYTFTVIVYCFVFFLWLIWVNKYSGITFNSGSAVKEANQAT